MNKKLIGLFTGVALFGLTASASNAAFISSNFVDNGDYTSDLVSGLDWLDMSYTDAKSYNAVLSMISSGGSLDGWSVATADQLDALFNNASDIDPLPTATTSLGEYVHVPFSSTVLTEAQGLINLLGSTYGYTSETSVTNYIYGFLDHAYADDPSYQHFGTVGAKDFSNPAITDEGLLYTDGGAFSRTLYHHAIGTFLVRESTRVPEPSSLLLMGIGLAGLGLVRRRKQS